MEESEPDWAKVLNTLYRGQVSSKFQEDVESSAHHLIDYLQAETNLNPEEIEAILEYLDDIGLVTSVSVDGPTPEEIGGLTEEGFQVAHERELRKEREALMESQNEATHTLATFTVILGVAALVQAAAAVFSSSFPILLGLLYIVVLMTLWLSRNRWLMIGGD